MGNRWAAGLASVACAAVLAACGGSDDQREDVAIQDRMAQAPQHVTLAGCVQTGQLETEYVLRNVRTEGGLQSAQAAPGQPEQGEPRQQAERTERQEAQARPEAQQQPGPGAPDASRLPARTDDAGITPYSFVQLRAQNPADLRQYVGQEVRITGTMTDTGANTIGTAGTRGTHQTPSGDTSAAAASEMSHPEKKQAEAGRIARESMASGTAPIVRVENIAPTGEECRDMPQAIDPPKR